MASCGGEQKEKKYLGDWYSSSGREVPAVLGLKQAKNAFFVFLGYF